jgi:TPR repeat protein
MWEEASQHGHLEALTDMGYLYENGLEDDDTGRTILEPNFDKAYSYYSKAASKNFPRALNNLATFYFSN